MNYNGAEYEETIDLKDLCIYVLRRWKMLLAAVLIGALALGAFSMTRPASSPSGPTAEQEAAVQSAQAQVSSLESQVDVADEQVEKAEEQVEDALKELEKAVRSAQEAVRSAEIQIENSDDSRAKQARIIENNKELIAMQRQILTELKELLSTHEATLERVQEVLRTETNAEARADLLAQVTALNNSIYNVKNDIRTANQRILSYEYENENLENSNTRLDERREDLLLDKEEKEEELAVSQEVVDEARNSLEKDKKHALVEAQAAADVARENLETAKETLKKAEQAVADATAAAAAPASRKSSVVKYTLLGAVLGGIVVCGVAFLQYFFDKKLRNAEELKEQFGLRVIGSLYTPAVEKRDKVNRMLDKWAGCAEPVDKDKTYGLIAAELQMQTGNTPEKILVTGTVDGTVLQDVAGRLKAVLPEKEFSVCAGGNPLYNADTMLQIKQCAILLVEGRHASDKREIAKLAEILQVAKARVLGAVLV